MKKLVVTLLLGAAAVTMATPALAGHRPKPPKCATEWTAKWTCVKMAATPRPKDFPANQPWLGEKCVKQGWKCEPPIK